MEATIPTNLFLLISIIFGFAFISLIYILYIFLFLIFYAYMNRIFSKYKNSFLMHSFLIIWLFEIGNSLTISFSPVGYSPTFNLHCLLMCYSYNLIIVSLNSHVDLLSFSYISSVSVFDQCRQPHFSYQQDSLLATCDWC